MRTARCRESGCDIQIAVDIQPHAVSSTSFAKIPNQSLVGWLAGIVEIKTRAKAADTDTEQKALRGDGATAYTVFVLRFGQAVRAIVCERT
mgnify:CR=1 FL=1